MADKYLKDDDEEYQFPSDEYIGHQEKHVEEEKETEAEFTPIPPKKSIHEHLHNIREKAIEHKRFVAICGIIVVILIAFSIIRPRHTKEVITETPVSTPKVAVQQEGTSGTTSETSADQLPLAEQRREYGKPAVSEGQVTRLQENAEANESQLNRLQHHIANLDDKLKKMQAGQQVLNANISNLNSQLQQLVTQLNNTGKPAKKTHIVLEEVLPVYHLRAVIPGRAWLESDQGELLTVAIGDKLQGYGRIYQINAQQGVVSTTSGKMIGFDN